MPVSSTNEIIAGLKAALETVPGVGRVDDRWGGRVTWHDFRKPQQAYWVITWSGYREEGAGVGTQVFERPTFSTRGWMPFNSGETGPNTTPTWYDLVEAVMSALRAHRSIAQNLGLPRLAVPPDTIIDLGDEKTDAVGCHHTVIEVTAKQHVTYTTS